MTRQIELGIIDVMRIDNALTTEALNLADGADIHDVVGLVAMYRSVAREGCNVADLERELRSYVARKRVRRGHERFCLVGK